MATVAVVIPVYATPENHRLDFLGKTLQSVRHQTYQNLVAVVVDDGSPADVAGFVRALHVDNVRYVRRTRSPTDLKTASNALNFGIDLCLAGSGEVLSRSEASDLAALAYLHSDDLLTADSIERRVSALCNGVPFVYASSVVVDSGSQVIRVVRDGHERLADNFRGFPHHTIMWTAEFASALKEFVSGKYGQAGIFDPRLSHGEDRDVSASSFEAAVSVAKSPVYLPFLAYIYRAHQQSISGEKMPEGYYNGQSELIDTKHFTSKRALAFHLPQNMRHLLSDIPWSLGYRLPEQIKRHMRPVRDITKRKTVSYVITKNEEEELQALLATRPSR